MRVHRVGPGVAAVLLVLTLLTVAAFVPPALGGTVAPLPTTTVRPAAAPEPGASAPTRVRVAALGLDGPVVPLGLDRAGALDVPRRGDVTGWYTGSPAPGRRGPSVLAAHVDWNHEPGPFFRLRELAAGDLVEVDRADGSVATFEVQAVRRYPKDAFPTDEVYGNVPWAGLRLVTCGGSFDRGARSYEDNVVAYAALVQPGRGPT
ncbi:class F sortase [Pseudonocardia endophytica]|uniref:class F sortase n=1 Tax=Pseudonocardia endophytica TaxID=401976 RepID=UPI001FB34729|nr:class F sortase [Pseudonocardia endophytica]